MFRLRISAWPSRCCVPSKPPSTRCPRPSRRAPSRRCCRAATCWASPRPAPARPRPSRCPCCSTSPASASARSPSIRGRSCWRRPASSRSRSPRSFDTYGRGLGLRLATVVGGLGYGRQIETLNRGVDILVATPGRLLDLVERGNVKLAHVTFLVLDEADRMFDMGFIRDVRRIVARSPSSARRCCSPPPCRPKSPSSRRRS